MPNFIAYGALIAWPAISLVLYLLMPAGRATIWTLLAGYLLLPTATWFDAPGMPLLDKTSITCLAVLALAPVLARSGEFRWPRSTTVNVLMALHVLTPIATVLTNGDTIVIGMITLPGINISNAVSFIFGRVMDVVPFVLGAGLLGNERGHRDILMAFAIAGIAYSIPVLAEIRLSPFLQAMIYNVINVEYFAQQIREGGFRAMVFLGHGLLVSAFLATSLLAALGLSRMRVQLLGFPMVLAVPFLIVVLFLNKSAGAIILAVLIGGLLVVLTPRRFVTVAFGVAILLVTYPAVRGSGLIPYQSMVSAAKLISDQRASSLEYRLKNEEILLTRAQERPLFGWGGYSRNRVIQVSEAGYTSDVSVTDGTWIIQMGLYGWIGYITCFGLLTYPIWRAYRMRWRGLSIANATLVAMLLLNLLDLIPNSSLRPITWLCAGALASLSLAARGVRQQRPQRTVTGQPAAAGPGLGLG